jgi:cysteinyl-tRNA synthetase
MLLFSLNYILCLWSLSLLSSTEHVDAWTTRSFISRKIDFCLRAGVSTDDPLLPELYLFNSKSRTKEPLRPVVPNRVSMYTCGPTVYDFAHVGNFRAFLTYDLIKRTLLYFGYDVDHVCNLTDVDDKIINRANEQGISVVTDLTRKYEELFLQDLHALNVVPANRYPRATEHIDEMMEMILELGSKDLAYEARDGSWYFSTANQEGYGKQLVQLNWDGMETTERGQNDNKRNPQDFVLWKAFKPGIDREDAAWESSEIRKGRPGWHIECSAMARKYLGDTIDIHGGGIDLQFPHHENEIAQSEGVTGKAFCNCWLHNGFVNINDEKMSKSLGNFLTLRTACPEPLDVRAYRYLVMSSQYRNPLSFTPEVMKAAKKSLKRIDAVNEQINKALTESDEIVASTCGTISQDDVSKALTNFEAALKDDMSMPRAAASLFGLVKLAEKEFKRTAKDDAELDLAGLQAISKALTQVDKVFGIFYEVPLTEQQQQRAAAEEDGIGAIPDEVIQLVLQRGEAKEAKDWDLADSLRARIADLGFVLKDVKGGDPIVSRVDS